MHIDPLKLYRHASDMVSSWCCSQTLEYKSDAVFR